MTFQKLFSKISDIYTFIDFIDLIDFIFFCYNIAHMSIKLPKIFLDSSDPLETKKAKGLLSLLHGQTTNPSLVVKNPEVVKYTAKGKKLKKNELLKFYKDLIQEIEKQIAGPISVEVYADWNTTAKVMLAQADDMFSWGRNIYIKFPTIPEGVKAAHEFVGKGGRVNMTLVFDEVQSAAVYTATLATQKPAFVSPFIGRWDDRGFNGLNLVKNIQKQYRGFNKKLHKKDSHVEVLAASIRSLDHFYASIFMEADIMTIPLKIIYDWIQEEKWMPDEHYRIQTPGLKSIVYQDVPYQTDYTKYVIEKTEGSLLDEGLNKFVGDWNKILEK